jgi:S1-C subfamily serine protease
VVRGWIGIVPADIDSTEARRFNLPQAGVVVAKLYVASPAAAVGMEPRDIILTVNGTKVASAQDTLTRIANAKPGSKVKITGLRGAENFSSVVEVTERPRNQ